jgi:hypothetical protein
MFHREVVPITLILLKPLNPEMYLNNISKFSSELTAVSIRKVNQLLLYREIIALYCEDHTKHTNTLCEYIQILLMLMTVIHMVTAVL